MGNMTKPPFDDQGPAFPNPLSTNHIVRALYIRAQRHPWVVKNRVPTIGAICGKGLRISVGGGGVNSLASGGSRGFLHLRVGFSLFGGNYSSYQSLRQSGWEKLDSMVWSMGLSGVGLYIMVLAVFSLVLLLY